MEIKKLSYTHEKAAFVLKGTEPYFVNTLRRILVNDVPTMAIDTVTFVENGSALYDEMIALRLGLVPLTTDLGGYNMREECKCKGKGCARCQLALKLDKTGPCNVYASDLKSSDPKVKPAFPAILIAKLLDKQALKIEAVARLGRGREHAKFTPGLFYFQGYPKFKIKEAKDAKACADACPKKILKLEGRKLKVTDETKCDLCLACADACPDAISVEGSKDSFIITVESWGQLPAKGMLVATAETLAEELEELETQIKEIK